MNLDELQSVQARERQSSDLQHLRSSFYREVGEYIQELTEERAAVVDRADDPFSSPEVRQLTDDIETAEQTVEAVYERRVGKVVKKASIAAAGMPVDDEGLTREEEALFEDLVARIESSRETVLSVLDGDTPSVSCSIDEPAGESPESEASPSAPESDPDPGRSGAPGAAADQPPETDGVSAADLMGDTGAASSSGSAADPAVDEPGNPSPAEPTADSSGASVSDDQRAPSTAEDREVPSDDPAEPADGAEAGDPASDPLAAESAGGGSDAVDTGTASAPPADAGEGGGPADGDDPGPTDQEPVATDDGRDVVGVPRTTVRVTANVGEVVGADDRDYDLTSEDVVTLPEPNADVLVEKDAAERLE
jgi:DNA replication factor GINS